MTILKAHIHASEHELKYYRLYMYFSEWRNADSVPKGNFGMVSTVPQSARLHSLDRLPGLSLIAFSLRGRFFNDGCYYYFSIRHHLFFSLDYYYYPCTFLPLPLLYSSSSVVVVPGFLSFSFPQHPSSATTRMAR